MIRVFVDTGVFFAASYSSTGASRELIRLTFQGQVQLVISDDVLEEARRNLAAKFRTRWSCLSRSWSWFLLRSFPLLLQRCVLRPHTLITRIRQL